MKYILSSALEFVLNLVYVTFAFCDIFREFVRLPFDLPLDDAQPSLKLLQVAFFSSGSSNSSSSSIDVGHSRRRRRRRMIDNIGIIDVLNILLISLMIS